MKLLACAKSVLRSFQVLSSFNPYKNPMQLVKTYAMVMLLPLHYTGKKIEARELRQL